MTPFRSLVVIVILFLTTGCTAEDAPHISVVVVVVDTLRADHLGTYGYARRTSPHLDRWAEQGRLFEHAQSTAPWTLPGFGSLYTGLLPTRHGAGMQELGSQPTLSKNRMYGSVLPIAEHLRARGMRTGAVVNNPFLGPAFSLDRGFEVYDHVPGGNTKSRRANIVVDRALALIDRWTDEPFFLVVHLFDPHMDYDAPSPFRGTFTSGLDTTLSLPITDPHGLRARASSLTVPDRNFVTAAYDEEVAFVDEQVGRLLQSLEGRGVLEHSLVVLTSDHGEELFEHGSVEHGHDMWQEMLHVPLLFWGPDVLPGREPGTVSLVDVAPTILEWLGVAAFPDADGISLWPNLSADVPIPQRTLYAERVLYGPARSAIFDWPFKVVVDGGFVPVHAYDLDADPHEEADLRSGADDRVSELAGQWRTLHQMLENERPEEPLEADETAHDPDTLERLRSLGYVR